MEEEEKFQQCTQEIIKLIYQYYGQSAHESLEFISLFHSTFLALSIKPDTTEAQLEAALVTSSRLLYLTSRMIYEEKYKK